MSKKLVAMTIRLELQDSGDWKFAGIGEFREGDKGIHGPKREGGGKTLLAALKHCAEFIIGQKLKLREDHAPAGAPDTTGGA